MKNSGFFEQRVKEEVNLLMSMQGIDRLFYDGAALLAQTVARGQRVFLTGQGSSEHLACLLARHWRDGLFGQDGGEEFIVVIPSESETELWPGSEGDLLVACALSGLDMELLRKLTKAGETQMTIMALTGAEPLLISGLSMFCLCVPSTNPLRISEQMLFLGHGLAECARHMMKEESAQVRQE